MAKPPHEVLGVRPGAPPDEIKRAYRKLVKQYHPDHYKDHPLEDLAKTKMQEINEAYDQLTNPNRQQPGWDRPSSNGQTSQNDRGNYQQPYQQWQQPRQGPYYNQGGLCGTDVCNSLGCLCCADSCCECMGGDLSGCC